MIKFDAKQVRKLLKSLAMQDKIILVGDHGVYLMCQSQPMESRTIVYAEGCHPVSDPEFDENKRALFGGDDGVIEIGTKLDVETHMGKDFFRIELAGGSE